MPTYLIRQRWTGRELAVIEAPTAARALEWAVRCGMSLIDADLAGIQIRGAFLAGADLRQTNLMGSDLAGCYLRRTDLRGANLRCATLSFAFMGGSDLRQADLRRADLTRADMRGTQLVGADLRGTILTGAKFEDAVLDWRWLAIPTEILRRRGGPTMGPLVAALAFLEDDHPWGWLRVVGEHDGHAAMTLLTGWLRDGDNAPDILRVIGREVIHA